MRFNELRLAEPIVRAVAAEGYTTPTPIQTKAIPAILAGKDVLGCAQTGTGKTAAFALPMLHQLAGPARRGTRPARHGQRGRRPRALVLGPTRELATQIFESFRTYGHGLPLRHLAVFGGVSQVPQVHKLHAGIDVLVATPGRLLDLMGQGHVDLRDIEILVLDEADRMLDMGFIRDIRKIVDRLPSRRQTLLFSATMPTEIRGLADSILHEPVFVKAAPVATPADAIAQSVYLVTRKDKPVLLARLLGRGVMGRTLVFTRTKYGADKLVKVLQRAGVEAGAIHGNKSQGARTRALDGFKAGKIPVLVATDIASRGIDVDDITHVINYDLPNVPETYVHRIGRTARAGAEGDAISFCDQEQFDDLRAIERLLDMKLEIVTDPDLETARPAPATSVGRGGGGNGGRTGGRTGGRAGGRAGGRPSGRSPRAAGNGPRRGKQPRSRGRRSGRPAA